MFEVSILILMNAANLVGDVDSFMLWGDELIHDHSIMVLLHVLVPLCDLMHCTLCCVQFDVSHAAWVLQAFKPSGCVTHLATCNFL